MTHSTARIETANASRYLQQLCKHFGHKVPVDFTPHAGRIDLPFGTCSLKADTGFLTMRVAGSDTDIARLERVIGDHLARFAFRENPAIAWQPAA